MRDYPSLFLEFSFPLLLSPISFYYVTWIIFDTILTHFGPCLHSLTANKFSSTSQSNLELLFFNKFSMLGLLLWVYFQSNTKNDKTAKIIKVWNHQVNKDDNIITIITIIMQSLKAIGQL